MSNSQGAKKRVVRSGDDGTFVRIESNDGAVGLEVGSQGGCDFPE